MPAPHTPPRAPYAADAQATRGRLHPEPASPTRTPFQRDRDRIVHSTAFRRLAHKTQVFVHHEGDHFRTRLTHTIEVAQIARALARAFGLDDDLAEAIALGHDLGHTPFGHAGEDALDACLASFGGFDHNSHGLRLVTELERHYADFDGLNLCQETLEGLVKHNGPLLDAAGRPQPRYAQRGLPSGILAYDARQSLHLSQYASLEAQAAALADDIAYNAHDLDDGLRAGLIDFEAIREAPYLAGLVDEIDALRPGLEDGRKIHELSRRLITRFIEDAIAETAHRLQTAGVGSAEDVAQAGQTLVALSPAMQAAERDVKAFLFKHMYRHPDVNRRRLRAIEMVRALFGAYLAAPEEMSPPWTRRAREGGSQSAVADYIAGMTDRFALNEFRRLFDPAARLR